MKAKYYFAAENDEICYDLEHHMVVAQYEGWDEIELFEAVPEKLDGYFWCRSVGEMGEDGDCGKFCSDYSPKNGKSGMCRHRSNIFYEKGKRVVFKVKPITKTEKP